MVARVNGTAEFVVDLMHMPADGVWNVLAVICHPAGPLNADTDTVT